MMTPAPARHSLSTLQVLQGRIDDALLSSRRQSFFEATLSSLGAEFFAAGREGPSQAKSCLEPRVASQRNVLIWSCVGVDGVSRSLRCLADSGAELDMLDARAATLLGLPLQSLSSPLHLRLGTVGRTDSVPNFVSADFSSGRISLPGRAFFVGNVQGYDAILGLPFIEDANLLIGSGRVKQEVEPEAESDSLLPLLETTTRTLPGDGAHCVALISDGVDARMRVGVEGEDWVGEEPHNPLLDVVDDPEAEDLSEAEADRLAAALLEEFDDVLCEELPDRLPPFRPVNHRIHLIDASIKTRPRSYPMPNRFTAQWVAHRELYVTSGRWSPAAIDSACALFAIPKKDPSEGRFVVNLKPRNANTVKMHTPLPDMRAVRAAVAAAPFRSQVDFKTAFEQVRVEPASVADTGFATGDGTFVSNVMQLGDCNAPDSMNRVTFMMFRRSIGKFLALFFDDAHIYSSTRRQHLRHLRIIFMTLRHYRFYLGRGKVNLFAKTMMSLGCVISDDGIEVDPKKWDRIRDWPTPRDAKDCLRFMGTINWMADHLPNVAGIMAPISALTGKAEFLWGKEQEDAFVTIKRMVPAALIPIDWAKVESGEHRLFLTGDASITGLGSVLSCGPTREEARPYRFHSAKFNSAQRNYDTTNQELLAIVEGCKTFQQHLIGYPFVVVTDHKALETYVSTLPTLTRRHVRMAAELSRFDFSIEFLEGKSNVIADSLSRLYETDVVARESDYVQEGDFDDFFPDAALEDSAEFFLLTARFRPDSERVVRQIRRALVQQDWSTLAVIADDQSDRNMEARLRTSHPPMTDFTADSAPNGCFFLDSLRDSDLPTDAADVDVPVLATIDALEVDRPPASASLLPVLASRTVDDDFDPLDLLGPLQPAKSPVPSRSSELRLDLPDAFVLALLSGYSSDARFVEIKSNASSWKQFSLGPDGLFYFGEGDTPPRLCVPRGRLDTADGSVAPSLREFVLNLAHSTLAHAGFLITLSYLRRFFWWDRMAKDAEDFCRSCETCARGKSTTSKPFGLLHPMPIPSRPWEASAMDFITGLPSVLHRFERVDSILVVTDVFSKLVHLLPLSSAATAVDVAQRYHDEVYRLHGLQASITSDRDPKFTGNFWRALHEKIGTKLKMSTAAHPETDGASENRVKTVSTTLRCLVEDDPDAWASRLTDVEFAINSSRAGATGSSPFELCYGFLPPPLPFSSWPSSTDVPGADGFAESIRLSWVRAFDAILGARLDMAVQANKHRRPDSPLFAVGNRVYVDTLHLSFPSSTTRKLLPRYIGPYLITAALPESSNYEIDFPAHFRVHRRVHASKLRPHLPNDADRFPARDFLSPSDLQTGDAAATPWVIEKIILDRVMGKTRKFLVRYLGCSSAEDEFLSQAVLSARAPQLLVAYIARKGGNLAPPGAKKIRRVK